MKILVINGSPKKEKSDTMHITRAFLGGMNEAEQQEIEIINVIDKHIEFCCGCLSCMKNGGVCRHNDDMKPIIQQLLNSDLLVLSFPLYCYTMPAVLKNLIERTLPLSSIKMQKVGERYEHIGQSDFAELKYLMICGCGFPNSKQNFEPAVASFKLMFPRNHTVITVPQSPMFNVSEASAVTAPRLELVKKAGIEYAKTGTIDAQLLAEIGSPMIPEEIYAEIVNGQA